MNSQSKIHFFFKDSNYNFKNRSQLKKFILGILEKENQQVNFVNFIFCSDRTILSINRRYLNHAYYTDIITFQLSEIDDPIQADIFISIERIKDNAKHFKTPVVVEFTRVLFHGVLHLCGYSDKKKKDRELIREKENFYLAAYYKKAFSREILLH